MLPSPHLTAPGKGSFGTGLLGMVVRKQRRPALFSSSWEHTAFPAMSPTLTPQLQNIKIHTVLGANVFILPLKPQFTCVV